MRLLQPVPRTNGKSTVGEKRTVVKGVFGVMSRTRTVDELDQRYILTPEKVKDAYLVHLIQTFTDQHDDWSIIIFTNTCK